MIVRPSSLLRHLLLRKVSEVKFHCRVIRWRVQRRMSPCESEQVVLGKASTNRYQPVRRLISKMRRCLIAHRVVRKEGYGDRRSISQGSPLWSVYRSRSCSRFGRPCQNSMVSGATRYPPQWGGKGTGLV